MSDSDRRPVRVVRRAPRYGVFLLLGAVLGAVVALVSVLAVPPAPGAPTAQTLGFLVLLFAPLGALLGGLAAVVLGAVAVRRARTVDAERQRPAAVAAEREDEERGAD